jgi:hypothetical protein
MKGRVNRRQTIWVVAASMFATAVLSVSAQGQSQWETSGTNIYYNAGNVGIGTNSPGTRLEVSGQGRFNPGASFSGIDTGWAAAFGYSAGNWGVRLGATGNQGVIQVAQNTTAYDLAVQPYGGNVGIGTTSPEHKLEVAGNVSLGGAGNDRYVYAYYNSSTNYAGMTSTSGGVLQFFTGLSSPAARLSIDTSGNVGIGTTSPGAKLHISSSGDTPFFVDSSNGQTYLNFRVNNVSKGFLGYTTGGNAGLAFLNGAGTAWNMLITDSGNVGIGTTSPGAKLHINGSGDTPFLIDSSNGQTYLNFRVNNVSKGFLGYTTGGNAGLAFLNGAGTAWNMLITDSGNVGIGTTSPGTKLEVSGQGRFNPGASFSAIDTGWAAAFGYSTGNWGVRLGATGNQGVIQVAQNTTAYDLAVQPYGGKVGIGTASPSFLLDVQGGQINASGGLCINGTCKASWSEASAWENNSGSLSYGAGNVGIGTTSPGTKLEVSGQGRFNPGASFSGIDTGWAAAFGYSTGNWGVRLGATGNQGVIQVAQNTTAYDLAVQPYGGNVGIGTAGPSEKLEIKGNLKVSADGSLPGNITAAGTIDAGTIKARYQDVAEWLPSSEQLAAGTVVVLDSTKSNRHFIKPVVRHARRRRDFSTAGHHAR